MGSVRIEFTSSSSGGGGVTSFSTSSGGGVSSFSSSSGGGVSYQRYHTGWQSREQERMPTRVARITKQHYSDIRAECLEQGGLFEDPDFPATNRSIYYSYDPGVQFKWMRPTEIVENPRMFIDGASRFDVKQGDLGNCWFLAAVASLCASKNTELLHRVVPTDNSFVDRYAGTVVSGVAGARYLPIPRPLCPQ